MQKKSIIRAAVDSAEECTVCTEVFDSAKRSKIVCPFCPEGAESACKSCVQRYLLTAVQNAHCMSCKHDWSLLFCHSILTKSWFVGPYRKSRQEKAVEREKGMMAEAMPIVEARQQRKTHKAEEAELRREIKKLQDCLYQLRLTHADTDMDEEVEVVVDNGKSKYVRTCPITDCRGLIAAGSWKCSLCGCVFCASCHVLKKSKEHVCKSDDVATAKAIMADSKPCPGCATRINRISGCDQMFCTQCHTPFSYATGKIVTGTIHNPHYYEFQRRLGHGALPRVGGDVPCGGLPDWYTIIRTLPNVRKTVTAVLMTIHELTGEVNDYLLIRLREKDTMDIRVAYLSKEIDESGLRRRLFVRERLNNKIHEIRNVLETFSTIVIEGFRDLITNCNTLKTRVPKRLQATERERLVINTTTEIQRVIDFCNTAMKETLVAMGFRSGPIMKLGQTFGGKTQLDDAPTGQQIVKAKPQVAVNVDSDDEEKARMEMKKVSKQRAKYPIIDDTIPNKTDWNRDDSESTDWGDPPDE